MSDDLREIPSELTDVVETAPGLAEAAADAGAGDSARDGDSCSPRTRDADRWVPFDLVTLDGETGAVLQPAAASVTVEGPEVPAWARWDPGSHVRQGASSRVEATIGAPRGHLADEAGKYSGGAYVSRRAARVRMVAPLRREADIRVRILDPSGAPVEGARVTGAFMGGPAPRVVVGSWLDGPPAEEPDGFVHFDSEATESVTCGSDPSEEDGWTRVRGIPHLLDERFWIVAGNDEREGFTGITLGNFGEAYAQDIRLPDNPCHVWRDLGYSFSGGG